MSTATPRKHRTRAKLLSSPGNSKLGPLIWSFSLPSKSTCPGATEACLAKCYVSQGNFTNPSVQSRYAANLRATRRRDFRRRVIAEVRDHEPRYLRVHVAGDFDRRSYINDWRAVALASPGTAFFAYTRSWRVARLLPALRRLAKLPNFTLWFSEDRDSGPSPEVPGVRSCFLAITPADLELVDPARHSLVFRDRGLRRPTSGVTKRVNGVLVCPPEAWPTRRHGSNAQEPPHITCGKCRICFTDRAAGSPGGPPNTPAEIL